MQVVLFKDTGNALWQEFIAVRLSFLNKSLENGLIWFNAMYV